MGKRRSIQKVPIAKIGDPALMIRTEDVESAEIQELAASIKDVGLLEPILVKPVDKHFILVYGWRRLQAHKFLDFKFIDAEVRAVTEQEAMKMRWRENEDRAPVNPADECTFIKQMIDFHQCTQVEIADIIGKSEAYVSQRLKVLNGPDVVYNALGNGKISFNQARELVKFDSDELAEHYTGLVSAGGASADVIRQWYNTEKQRSEMEVASGPMPEQDREDIVPPNQFVCDSCRTAKSVQEVRILKVCATCNHELEKAAASVN